MTTSHWIMNGCFEIFVLTLRHHTLEQIMYDISKNLVAIRQFSVWQYFFMEKKKQNRNKWLKKWRHVYLNPSRALHVKVINGNKRHFYKCAMVFRLTESREDMLKLIVCMYEIRWVIVTTSVWFLYIFLLRSNDSSCHFT